MKNLKIVLCFLFIAIPLIGYSQNSELSYSLNGFVKLDHFSFFKEKSGLINSRNQGTAQLDLKSNYKDNYGFFSSIEFRNDLSDSERNRTYMREIYLDIFSSNIDLRVGKQIILWGRADGFNPTSNLTPIDYSDILDTDGEDIGIFAINSKVYVDRWEIQAVYSPTFQSSIFPQYKSRWQSNQSSINIEDKLYFTKTSWQDVRTPETKFSNSQYAIKLSRSFNNIDFSFSYYNGLNDIPYIQNNLTSIENDTVVIDISQLYYKHQVLGTDFSWVVGKFILKGEGALFIPRNVPNNQSYFQYVIGAERTFNNILEDKNLFVITQWMHELKSGKVQYRGADFNHLFQRNVMIRAEMDINKDMKMSLQAMYALKYQDYYIKPEFTYNISDGLNLTLLTDILGGNKSKNGFFSSYSDNNRIQTKLKYSF